MYPNHGRHVSYQGQPSVTLAKALLRTHSTPQSQLQQMQAAQAQAYSDRPKHRQHRSTLSHGGKPLKVSSRVVYSLFVLG